MNENVAKLRDELSRLTGRVRVPTLVRLGHELTNCYWRSGPGQPGALVHLSAAIEVLDEAYRLLDAGDPARGQAAAQLGWLLTARYSAHGSATNDRDTGMFVLDEALKFTDLPPMLAAMARLSLGQLFLSRATEALTLAGARGGFLHGLAPGAGGDADAAARLFREILDGHALSSDVTAIAQTMLTLAESIGPLLSGDLARFDLGKIMAAMSGLQRLQQNGMPMLPFVPGDPLDYPVTDMRSTEHQPPTVPPRRHPPVAVVSAERYSARQAARDRLATLVHDPGPPVWEQARALLLTGPSAVDAGDLDAFVGAAANAVDAAEDGDPVERGLDRLLSAVGLCLRERGDGSGWDDPDDTTSGTYLAAAAQLLSATADVPPEHPAAIVVVEALGGLLDDSRPLSGAITEVAAGFLAYAEKIPRRPPVVSALLELCRTVTALVTGAAVDPAAFAAAAQANDHPWQRLLSTAVAHSRVAAAVRAGEPIDVDPALGHLATVLDSLRRGDEAALRTALDAVAVAGRSSPAVAAVLGGARLRLDDVDVAIPLLSEAIRGLDDDGLRTRTWWRLSEAYRKRGAAGDAVSCRDAGLNALRGPDPDPVSAARFARWMLVEGRGVEAYTALEVTAAIGGSSGERAEDLLAHDVLTVLIGVAPPPGPAAEVPSPASVARAVREIGAAALLYLCTTDDAGRTAGVLCLDPATDRLDVLANVPVTDPLASDDAGWPAVLGRWTSGRLLIAATGDLERLALAAVRDDEGHHLIQDIAISHVSSGAQVVQLAERSFAPVDAEPLFVVNPRGDRDSQMADVMVVRRLFYPRSICLGRALEPVDGVGTPDEVLKHLPGASLAHLACGRHETQVELAGGEAAVRGAGVVILAEGSPSGLLDAGFAGVVGWHWQVPAPVAALALFIVHLELVDHRLPPAAAVNAVQRWMLDLDRVLPPFLTGAHLHTVTTTDLTRPALWAALAYHGR